MKLGDIVQWESQSSGTRWRKKGEIIAVVPPGGDPCNLPIAARGNYKIMFDGGPRNHESYVVLVGGSEQQYGALYWPRVKHLELVGEA